MKFTQFLDIRYRQLTIQLHKEFNFFHDGKIKAISAIGNFLRFSGKWIGIPALFIEFWLVKARLRKAPISPVVANNATVQAPDLNLVKT